MRHTPSWSFSIPVAGVGEGEREGESVFQKDSAKHVSEGFLPSVTLPVCLHYLRFISSEAFAVSWGSQASWPDPGAASTAACFSAFLPPSLRQGLQENISVFCFLQSLLSLSFLLSSSFTLVSCYLLPNILVLE